jgi:hypothetical protein
VKKRTTAIIFGLLLLLTLLFSNPTLSFSARAHGAWGPQEGGNKASVIYASTWKQGSAASEEAEDACATIKYLFDQYSSCSYCVNGYGSGTTLTHVLNNISYCDDNFDYTTVFHYGHGHMVTLYGLYIVYMNYWDVPVTHYFYYDNYGTWIMDNAIYFYTDSGTHNFVFIWTCSSGDVIGYYDENWYYNPHVYYLGTGAVGMPFAWHHTDDLSSNGYASPDSGPNCFIGFKGVSKWIDGTAAGDSTYGDFTVGFYLYALQDNYKINKALDYASQYVWDCNFNETDLYNGYWDWWEVEGMPADWYYGQMRVYGNGNNLLPEG